MNVRVAKINGSRKYKIIQKNRYREQYNAWLDLCYELAHQK